MSETSNTLITFSEIKETPMHYLGKLKNTKENTFLLFQYGPYLVSKYIDFFIGIEDKLQNDFLILMVQVAKILGVSRIIKMRDADKYTFKMAKEKLLGVAASTHGKYYQVQRKLAMELFGEIQKVQYEDKSLESAMLNYAPITQYAKTTLVKPEMTHTEPVPRCIHNFNDLDIRIQRYFVEKIFLILQEPTEFINPDDPSEDFIKASTKVPGSNSQLVSYYFIMVYLRYASTDVKDYEKKYKDIFNLNDTCNKLHNGERVNIKDALEAFSKL
jgi:hypothetical protein